MQHGKCNGPNTPPPVSLLHEERVGERDHPRHVRGIGRRRPGGGARAAGGSDCGHRWMTTDNSGRQHCHVERQPLPTPLRRRNRRRSHPFQNTPPTKAGTKDCFTCGYAF